MAHHQTGFDRWRGTHECLSIQTGLNVTRFYLPAVVIHALPCTKHATSIVRT